MHAETLDSDVACLIPMIICLEKLCSLKKNS